MSIEAGGMSDHLCVEAKLKVACGWTSTRGVEGVSNVLKCYVN